MKLGRFTQNESGRWVYRCSDCQHEIELAVNVRGDISASSSGQTICSTVPHLLQWLRDNGFQS
jgi:hypothetical protein